MAVHQNLVSTNTLLTHTKYTHFVFHWLINVKLKKKILILWFNAILSKIMYIYIIFDENMKKYKIYR